MLVPTLSAYSYTRGTPHVVQRQVSTAALSATASDPGDGAVISAEDLIHTADEHWNVSGASVLAAWLLTVVVGIVIATMFSTVRGKDRCQLYYFPRVASQKDKVKKWKSKIGVFEPLVPVVDKGYFGWLTPQLKLFWLELFQPFRRKSLTRKDTEMLEMIGLDGITYLHFLRLLRWLFLAITLFAALPLTIANYHLNTNTEYGSRTTTSASDTAQQVGNMTAEDGQQMGTALVDDMLVFTATNVVGNGLWVHIGFEWVVTGLVIFFVFAYSSHYDLLVRKWVEINYNDTSFRSLLVTDFRIGPKRRAKDENGQEYHKKNYVRDAKDQVCAMLGIPESPHAKGRAGGRGDVTVTLTYRNMSKLSKLMDEFKNEHFSEFSRLLTAYLRRNMRQFGEGAIYDSCWDRVMGNARNVVRRTDVKGAAMLLKKERIEMEQVLARCEPANDDTTVVEGEITSAFVTFATTKRAYAALKTFKRRQKMHHKISGPDVQRAPRAYNIIWENLDKVGLSKRGYSWTGVFILLFVFGINLIPLAVITLLANYEALLEYFPTLQHANETSTFWSSVFALLGGIVPPSISALFAYLLPYIVRRLNKWSGALTRGELDKTVVRQLFVWLLVFNFVFFSLMGIIWETYLTIKEEIGKKSSSEIWESLGDIPAKVTKAYISQSSYWLSWYPIRALVTCIQLLQLPRIGLKMFQSFTAETATDLHELAKPPKFEFAIEYVHALFAMAVALVLTPLAPIVAMCSTIYFWAMTVVHYNTLHFVEDSKETDGKCWRIARNRLLAATVMMQLLMTVTIWLKTRTPTLILLATLPVGLIIFVKYREGEDDLFLKVIDLVSERGLADDGPIPQYEHALLQRNWMPEFHYTAEDRVEYLRALDRFEWMRPLFTTVDWENRGRRKKGRFRWREGRHQGR